jgi:hypothetical protein
VTDTFRDGACPARGTGVRYEPIFHREAGAPLQYSTSGSARGGWDSLVGTAFGLTCFKDGQFTLLPFDMAVSFRGDVATLEAFFGCRPGAVQCSALTSVGLGLSFVAAFGQPLVKADLIFSAVVDRQNRLGRARWAGAQAH